MMKEEVIKGSAFSDGKIFFTNLIQIAVSGSFGG
jgi:hypothetical protein